jgi:hypothetical protein
MRRPRPVGEAGRGGSGSAGRHDRAPYSAPVRTLRLDLLDHLEAAAEARRSGEHAAAEAETLAALLMVRLLSRAVRAKAVSA